MSNLKFHQVLLGAVLVFFFGWGCSKVIMPSHYIDTENEGLIHVADLRTQLDSLSKDIELFSGASRAPSFKFSAYIEDSGSTIKLSSAASSSTEDVSAKFTAAIKSRNEKLMENYKNIKNYNLNAATSANYEAEPYAELWAGLRTERLRNSFLTEQRLNNYSVKSIDCKSKHCRIEVFFQRREDIGEIGSEMNKLKLEDNGKPLFISLSEVNYNDGAKTASIYLTDDFSASLY